MASVGYDDDDDEVSVKFVKNYTMEIIGNLRVLKKVTLTQKKYF